MLAPLQIVIAMHHKENAQQQTDENGRSEDQNHHARAQAVVGHGVPLWDNQANYVYLRTISAMAQFYSAKRRVTTRQIITVEATDLDPFGQGVASAVAANNSMPAQNYSKKVKAARWPAWSDTT